MKTEILTGNLYLIVFTGNAMSSFKFRSSASGLGTISSAGITDINDSDLKTGNIVRVDRRSFSF